jgi:hypothetical protein
MDFYVDAGKQNARRIAVYPSPTSGYHVIISLSDNNLSEPDVTVRKAQSEDEVARLLEKEGVARTEIERRFAHPGTSLATILTTLAGSLPLGLLIAMALIPMLAPF